MAQWIARMTSDHKVGGSSPSGVVLFYYYFVIYFSSEFIILKLQIINLKCFDIYDAELKYTKFKNSFKIINNV